MKYYSGILIAAALISACAAGKETREETPPEAAKPKYDESFDPVALSDDDIVVKPLAAETPAPAEEPVRDRNQTAIEAPREVNGFRVQILATNNIETASLTEQEAMERFRRDGHETYLLFEAPLYKVRIGDCHTRAEAEALRDMALSYGYSGAFIVKTKVRAKE